ncbi:hypothetical protein J5N97_015415 [Dioscorea zingiberensis]|uniref:Uncharacterized protein n=1 Tax=Dioscorea zingiberensis TaxID=325984 RepID=A0A9D5CUA5_9LILI|nr:hypothetical protein J5N97_015415 [Dioscorea zingiberensis]
MKRRALLPSRMPTATTVVLGERVMARETLRAISAQPMMPNRIVRVWFSAIALRFLGGKRCKTSLPPFVAPIVSTFLEKWHRRSAIRPATKDQLKGLLKALHASQLTELEAAEEKTGGQRVAALGQRTCL